MIRLCALGYVPTRKHNSYDRLFDSTFDCRRNRHCGNVHDRLWSFPFAQVIFVSTASEGRYIAGNQRTSTNHIQETLRSGGTRTDSDWEMLILALSRAWYEVVGTDKESKLQSIATCTEVIAAMENGLVMAHAGLRRRREMDFGQLRGIPEQSGEWG